MRRAPLAALLLALACGDAPAPASTPPTAPPATAAAPAAAPPAPPSPAAIAGLDGRFVGMERCGQTQGGTPIFIGYTLELKGGNGRLDADGYQTLLRKKVTVSGNGAERALVLVEAGPDDISPNHPKPGARLARLEDDAKGLRLTPVPEGLVLACEPTLLLERE